MTNLEFRNHSIFQKSTQLLELIKSENAVAKLEIEKIIFFKTACQYLIDRTKITLPELITIAELNTISNEFENALTQINNYLGSDNIGHINNATNSIYSALSMIKNFPIAVSKNDFNFTKIISDFKDTLEGKLLEIDKQKTASENELNELNKKLEASKFDLSTLSKQHNKTKNELDTITHSFKTDLQTVINDFKLTSENQKTALNSELVKDKNKIEVISNEIIVSLKQKQEEASRLVDVIGNTGVAGSFRRTANYHQITSNRLRSLAIILMLLLSIFMLCTIYDLSDSNFIWQKSVLRILGASILIYPASYLARESEKHRKIENINRRLEIELAAINPFIEMLDDAKKQEIKVSLVDKYFGNENQSNESNESEKLHPQLMNSIFRFITDIVNK